MNRLFITLMVVMLSSMTTIAQDLTEGFYRVQNFGSGRYLYVKDCTGDVTTLGADMGALELWPNLNDAISDPGSVMYLEKHGSSWDITSQNTGVNAITGKYMTIAKNGNYCMVYYAGQYLYETGTSDFNPDQGIIDAKTSSEMPGKSKYKLWLAPYLDSSTDNYFGFKPTVTASGKSYASFYAAFAYTPVSNNIKTWYVSKIDKTNGIAVIKEITGTVAKSQPVIIECAGTTTSANKVDLTTATGNKATDNIMKGVYFSNGDRYNIKHTGEPALVQFDATTMRVLGNDAEGNLAFVNSSSNLTTLEIYKDRKWQNITCIPHNTSYIVVDSDCPATLQVMTEEDYKHNTGITNITVDSTDSTPYTIYGTKASSNDRIVIINGKKVIR